MTEHKLVTKGVRDDFIPGEDYVSPQFAALEKARLWPRAWLMAGRVEEVENSGQFLTFDISDESITVVRTSKGELKAFYNVCPHRGRRLTSGCGKMGRFFCKYHGWNWTLEGKPVGVVDRDDWDGQLPDDEISLVPVRVDSWNGWVFVCMDDAAPELRYWLSPAPDYLDVFDVGSMRYKWRRQTILPANWKVALEAFTEGYHVQTTHRQVLDWSSDYTISAKHGLHGNFGYAAGRPLGLPSPRLGEMGDIDVREGIIRFYEEMRDTLDTTMTDHTMRAARRLREETTAEDKPMDVMMKFMQLNREEHEAGGVPWPAELTLPTMSKAGTSWHIFPNMVFLQGPGHLLGYRARPNGDDPDTCIFDVYALERYPQGQEPKPEVKFLPDIHSVEDWGLILTQDFQNMADIQQGMKSRGFKGARPNPKQELAVSNFHAAIHQFIA
ncbi:MULTISPECIES: aromatic ring-hydroxylating oxygenase subunit alpha [unclassified Sphingobium]|uniref:aromatic ring-hydroxylating oxygenase subunit alpha n=1 Tax=unclassified Sphingobium TaxID=2611147 RepID=UPI000D1732C6|nr:MULTISPECIES: aromatic ring-hydroxylating dioxygenase subunit alpha [unclassified Sphingobium]MBG6120046.1 phenylpropionate dioxygenase-like ring-hydroxylating dioxygenase large terminal subunit [Sphingobium sp. JAI105]PSO12899.1 (2Fe-2S)-binding protein [Sphingobium sp. AEW4]TWD05753.1 Rieske-like 2Fe-2S protein [Sphingobium sp. AEW010]TWD23306.1 Rieske-like 2Fe-2S protein [Sphingobium sp. AEW013]TWD25166.1 Rieske-like 2Fe-2S protein [Sphingobium sp. AEW001]